MLLGNNLLLYCALPFGPLFVSFIIAIRVCPKYPELGQCILYHVALHRRKKGEGRLNNLSTDAQTATKDKTFSA